MKLLSSITLALLGLSYGQVDYESYDDFKFEPALLNEVDDLLANLENDPTAAPPSAGIAMRARSGGPSLPPAIQSFASGARKLPPGIELSDFIGPNGFQTQRFLRALQAALKKQAEDQKRRQQEARQKALAAAAAKKAAEEAAEQKAAEEAAAIQAAEEEAARKAAAIQAAKAAAAEAARKAAEEARRQAAAEEAAKRAAEAAAAEAVRKAAEEARRKAAAEEAAKLAAKAAAAEAERQRQKAAAKKAEKEAKSREQLRQAAAEAAAAVREADSLAGTIDAISAQAMDAMMMLTGDFNSLGNSDGMVASSSGGRPSSGRPSADSAVSEISTRDFIGVNAGDLSEEVFNSCRVCNKMTAEECAQQSLVTCYMDVSRDGVFGFAEDNMVQDNRVCMLQTEQRRLTNGSVKTLFTSRCVTPMACEAQLKQNFISTSSKFAMQNRCKHSAMLRNNGNVNKSECAFCNKLAHSDPNVSENNQFFPGTQAAGQPENDYIVFNTYDPMMFAWSPMTMGSLFPTETSSPFPATTYGLWSEDYPLGPLMTHTSYTVEA